MKTTRGYRGSIRRMMKHEEVGTRGDGVVGRAAMCSCLAELSGFLVLLATPWNTLGNPEYSWLQCNPA